MASRSCARRTTTSCSGAIRTRSARSARRKPQVPAEFDRPARGLTFNALPDRDAYAPETGFVAGFPAARDEKSDRAWLTHCYGMVGAGRDNAADSGSGAEALRRHRPRATAPRPQRHPDRPRRAGNRVALGHATRKRPTLDSTRPLKNARRCARCAWRQTWPEAARSKLEVLRTDTQTFTDLIESRRNRTDEWTKYPAGHIEVCNVLQRVRSAEANK